MGIYVDHGTYHYWRDNNYDVIFHLAELIAIPYSYKAAESYVDTNIKGTLNLMEACINSNILVVIVPGLEPGIED